jgi:hypothetical protein
MSDRHHEKLRLLRLIFIRATITFAIRRWLWENSLMLHIASLRLFLLKAAHGATDG